MTALRELQRSFQGYVTGEAQGAAADGGRHRRGVRRCPHAGLRRRGPAAVPRRARTGLPGPARTARRRGVPVPGARLRRGAPVASSVDPVVRPPPAGVHGRHRAVAQPPGAGRDGAIRVGQGRAPRRGRQPGGGHRGHRRRGAGEVGRRSGRGSSPPVRASRARMERARTPRRRRSGRCAPGPRSQRAGGGLAPVAPGHRRAMAIGRARRGMGARVLRAAARTSARSASGWGSGWRRTRSRFAPPRSSSSGPRTECWSRYDPARSAPGAGEIAHFGRGGRRLRPCCLESPGSPGSSRGEQVESRNLRGRSMSYLQQ